MISVGLELGSNAIKVAVVEGGRSKVKLKSFEVRKVDAKKGEAEDDIVSVLQDVLKEVKAPSNQIVCSLRAQDCMIREIVVPFSDEDKIRKTVKYQAENYFTSISIDDLVIDYIRFSEEENRSKLMVAGIKKSHVGRRLELLEECGVDPQAIDLDVAALYNAYAHVGVFAEVEGALIVEVKADTLKIGVVEDGQLRMARAIRMHLGSMRLDVVKPGVQSARMPRGGGQSGVYETAADESARLPVVILDDGEDEAFSLEDSGITEVEKESILHRVFMEIDRTVAAVQLSREIELICLTGPSVRLKGIEKAFSEHFEIDAKRIDLASSVGWKDAKLNDKKNPSLMLEGGVALGLALKGLGIDHSGMDFRQEEFRFQGTFTQLKRGVACMLTLLFTLTFVYAFSLKQDLREKRNRLESVVTMQRNLYTVLLPELTDPNRSHQELKNPKSPNFSYELEETYKSLSKKYGAGDLSGKPQVSALTVLLEFGKAKRRVPKRWNVKVNKVNINPVTNRSRFVCWANDQPGAVELASAFENHPTLEGIARDVRPLPPNKGGGCTFEFIVKLKPQKNGPGGRR